MNQAITANLTTDSAARATALDPARSFIVQAPAGSGKTSLLVARYLALLATVNFPEEIVAITFTRKAASEMQNRIMTVLVDAQKNAAKIAQNSHQEKLGALARKVLERNEKLDWNLLQNPSRLQISTIDALCRRIAEKSPLTAKLGLAIDTLDTENAQNCYREAVENLLQNANDSDATFRQHFDNLLLHLDNDRERVIKLAVEMLAKREQWLPYVIGARGLDEIALRQILEQNLQNSVTEIIAACEKSFPNHLRSEFTALARFAGLPEIDNTITSWQGASSLLLTKENEWRKQVDKRSGFPAAEGTDKKTNLLRKEMKARALQMLRDFAELGDAGEILRQNLVAATFAPPTKYNESEWKLLLALFELLPQLVAHLKIIFTAQNACDYSEISMAADRALGDADAPSDLALVLDYRLKHLLVDEFQDTSLSQFRLIEKLTAGFEPDDGRTLFLVGDPMQSIYRFRQAEVGLFLRAQHEGVGNINLHALQLTTNFRADSKILNWINAKFPHVFPRTENIAAGAVPYHEATYPSEQAAECVGTGVRGVMVTLLQDAEVIQEADFVVNKLQEILAAEPDSKIAILLSTRTNAAPLTAALKSANLSYSSTELELLAENSVIQDLFALTCALTNLTDRVAWLSILRAPWCGVTLTDLHALANVQSDDSPECKKFLPIWQIVSDEKILAELKSISKLSTDGYDRIVKFSNVISPSVASRDRVAPRKLVETAWLNLGGPACLETCEQILVAEKYLEILGNLSPQKNADWLKTLRQKTENLHLSSEAINAPIQIMTIHKAKGLEFPHVIVPQLDRIPKSDTNQLLLWLERAREHEGSEILFAPIHETGAAESAIYKYLKAFEKRKSSYEAGRVLYVAATRAQKSLHLTARVASKSDDESETNSTTIKSPSAGSLLEQLWTCREDCWLQKVPQITEPNASDDNRSENLMPRLTLNWQAPYQEIAPIKFPENSNYTYQIQDKIKAQIGTVIHTCLRNLARDFPTFFQSAQADSDYQTAVTHYIASQKKYWQKLLFNARIYKDQTTHLDAIIQAITNIASDPIGRWIFGGTHQDAQNELAISALLDGEIKHLVVDRTFVDQDGVRWIIDYKTSIPNADQQESTETFLAREENLYRPQLEEYAHAWLNLEERPIALGLYFPLCGLWRKLVPST